MGINTSLLNNITLDATSILDGPFDGNGVYRLWQSSDQSTPQSITSVEVIMSFSAITPAALAGWFITGIIEAKDDVGNYHPIHSNFEPWIAADPDNPRHVLTYGPHIRAFEGNVPIDATNGDGVIMRDHRKQGVLPDDFRVALMLREKKFGSAEQFQSVNVTLSYNSYAMSA